MRHIPLAAAAASTVVSSAALAEPVAEAIKPVFVKVGSPTLSPEHPNDKVRRLGREIMETLRDPSFIGFDRLTITAEHVGYDENPVTEARKELVRVMRLIYRHERAWLAFDRSCPAADSADRRFGGPEAVALNRRLDRAEARAFDALLKEPALQPGPRNRKATYLLTTLGRGGRWEPDIENTATLLSSLL